MRITRKIRCSMFSMAAAGVSVVTSVNLAFAATDAHLKAGHLEAGHTAAAHIDAAHGHPAVGIDSLVWPLINFVLYLVVFRYLYKKYAKPAILARAAGFEEHLRAAAKVLEDADTELARVEDEYKRIGDIQRELRERLATEGAQMSAQIIAQAEITAGNMKRDVVRKIARELSSATADVKRQVVARATALAREQLQGKLSEQDDLRLRQEAIKGLF